VALLGRPFAIRLTPPPNSSRPSTTWWHLTAASLAIPEKLWQVSLKEAQHTECFDLGYAAYQSNNQLVAELAFHSAADAGDSDGMHNLGVLFQQRDEMAEAETWWRQAAQGSNSVAMSNLAVLLKGGVSWLRRRAGSGGQPRPATA
jgi:TPR repeat protein